MAAKSLVQMLEEIALGLKAGDEESMAGCASS